MAPLKCWTQAIIEGQGAREKLRRFVSVGGNPILEVFRHWLALGFNWIRSIYRPPPLASPGSYRWLWRRDFLVAAGPTKLANDPVERSCDALGTTDLIVLCGRVPEQGKRPFLGAMR
jgi:hypothetical protein